MGLDFTERIKDVQLVLMRDRQVIKQMGLQDRKVTTDVRKKGIKDLSRFYVQIASQTNIFRQNNLYYFFLKTLY